MSPPGELKRQLGLGSATALVVGEVIGVGIFLTPAGMARALGSPFWLLAVWLLMGVVTLSGALCMGELAARFPAAGGGYVYLRQAYGPDVAFLFGWMSLLLLDPGLTAALATGLASYAGYTFELSDLGRKALAADVVLALAAANILGVRLSAGLLRLLTVFKVGLLAFIACWGFGRGLGDWSNFTPLVGQQPGPASFGEALVAAFFAFAGWWDMSRMAGEVRDPGRTLPRALLLGIVLVTAVYIVTSAAFLYLVPVSQITTAEAFAAQAGEVLFGRVGGVVFSGIVIIAVLGCLASIIMSAPRLYYAMGRDGLFLPGLTALHPRFGTPARAIVLQAILACALIASGTFEQILAYFFFAVVAFLALLIAGLFILRWRSPPPTAYRTPGYPVTPLLFLIPVTVLLVLLFLAHPVQALIGVDIVLLGVPVYYMVFRRKIPVRDLKKS